MPLAQIRPDYLSGAARVSGPSGSLVWSAGIISACSRVSTGVYQLTCDSGGQISAFTHLAEVTPIITDTGEYGWGYNIVDDETVEIRTLANGAPFDLDFTVEIHRVRQSTGDESLPAPAPPPPPPSSVVPGGGLPRQVLSIDGSSAMAWAYVENLLPAGYSLLPITGAAVGNIYYYNIGWAPAPASLPGGAVDGQFLGWVTGSAAWASIIQVPAGGSDGEVVGKVSGSVAWTTITGLPSGGTEDQIVQLLTPSLTPTWVTLSYTRSNTFTLNSDAANTGIELATYSAISSTTVNSDLLRNSFVTSAALATTYLRSERNRASGGYADIGPTFAIGVPGTTANIQSTLQWNSGNGTTAYQAGVQLTTAIANGATRRYLSTVSGESTSGAIFACQGLVSGSVTIGFQSYGAGSSVVIGKDAVMTGNNSNGIGAGISGSGTDCCFMGRAGVGSSTNTSAVFGNGFNLGSGGSRLSVLGNSIAIGSANTRCVVIGTGSITAANVDRSIAIGDSTSLYIDDTILIGAFLSGAGASPRTAVIGGSGAAAGEWTLVLGMDYTLSAPQGARFQPSFPTGGNVAGSSMRILGGFSTGSAVGGSVTIETCGGGAAPTALNTMVKQFEAAQGGRIAFFGVTPVVQQSSAGVVTVADLVTRLQAYGLLS